MTVQEQLSAWGYATPDDALDAAYDANKSLIASRRSRVTRVPVPRPLPTLTNYAQSTDIDTNTYVVADFFWQHIYEYGVGRERLVGRINCTDAEKVF